MDKQHLLEAEELGVKGDTILHQTICRLVSHCRTLQHELDDPNYLYSGRIHRQAILSRNEGIRCLQAEKKALEDKVHELEALIDQDILARRKV